VLALILMAGIFLQATPSAQAKSTLAQTAPAPGKEADTDSATLLKVKRIYVESFGDDIISKELQSMIVSALVATKRFKVTENRERFDATLKGVALEKSSQELHAYGESTAVGGASGSSHGDISGSVVNGNGTISGSSNGGFVARHMGTSDSSLNTETVNEARIAIRLVDPDGDVIWTSTQESKGAKYKGSSADVADKCVKQLLRDVEKLEGANVPLVPSSVVPPAASRR
jgi:curli biogenesis system outer membrane secretion channel CsgG